MVVFNKYFSVMLNIMLTTGLILSISACGFRLKQYQPLSDTISHIEIVSEGQARALSYPLEKALKNRGISIIEGAPVKLNILKYSEDKSSATVNANNTRRLETKITSKLSFSLIGEESAMMIPPQKISITKEYANDNANISAKAAEERLIIKEIKNEMVKRILSYLEGVDNDTKKKTNMPEKFMSTESSDNTKTENSNDVRQDLN